MAYAARTERVKLGTGVLPIYSRTPVATAQAAATIDELSTGRMVLGLGVSHRPVVEGWYGSTIDKPVREMREYVAILRAIFRGEDPPQGERFQSAFHFMGLDVRADLPIYIAGLSPAMLRLAGEVGDGVILWLCNPDYVREVVVPEVTKGRERAGKELDGFDIVAAVPAAVTGDAQEAREKLRADLVPYFHLPFYKAMIERSGFPTDAGAPDEFIDVLAAIGTPDDAAASVQRYRDAGATSPCIGPIAKTDFDTTLEALAHLAG
jgi:alkanesulfonate monooxygenase SsuD/methylene tetrahydromethanopterin reductase-like flavin-dependent oxidoreductase (luciferase family)